jgi:DNA-binding YbaB/EbfC family protein
VADPDDARSDDDAGAAVPGLPDIELSGAELLSGDLGSLLSQAQDMMAAQAAAADREVEGVAGGGVVRIRATGTGQVLGVTIAPEVVDPADVPMLEDLVLAALHDVNARLAEIQRAALGPLAGLADLFASDGDSGSGDDDAGPDQP